MADRVLVRRSPPAGVVMAPDERRALLRFRGAVEVEWGAATEAAESGDRERGPGWKRLAGVVLPLAIALIAVAALLARPVTTPTRERVAWPRPPASPWASVSREAFGPGSAVGGVAAQGDQLIAVGTDGRTSSDGFVRPGVWTAAAPDRWRRAEAGAVELDPAWSEAGVRMHDVAASGGLLVAVGEANVAPRTVGAAWTSRDDGRTWQVSSGGGDLDRAYATPFAVVAAAGGFVAVGGGVDTPAAWTSQDGRTWTPADVEPGSGGLVDVVAGRSGLVAADRGGRLWHSATGQRWTRAVRYGRHPDVRVRGVAAAPDGSFLALGSRGGDGFRDGLVLHSEDGRNWSEAVAPLGIVAGSADVALSALAPSSAVGAVAVGDAGGRAVAFSARGGAGWAPEHLPALPDATSTALLTTTWHGTDLAIGFADGWDGRRATVWLRTPNPPPTVDGGAASIPTSPNAPDADGAPDLVIAVGDGGLWVTDGRDGSARDLPLSALGVADPRLGMVGVGDALVVRGAGDARVVRVESDAEGEPAFATRGLGQANFAVPSGRAGRVWLVTDAIRGPDAAGSSAGLGVREVDFDGRVTVPLRALPPGAQPLAGVGTDLVILAREGWTVWSPADGRAVALGSVVRVLATQGPLMAWCEHDRCTRILIGRPGDPRPLAVGVASRQESVIGGTLAPGGRWLASVVATDGSEPQDVVVTDLRDGSVVMTAPDLAYPQLAWDPTGTRLTVWEQRGTLRSLDPATGTERLLALTFGRATVHSLDVLATP